MNTRTVVRATALALTVVVATVALSGLLIPYRAEHSAVATASPETAWDVISDLENHANWNPYTVELKGEPVVGTQLFNRTNSGGRDLVFRPEVLNAEPGRELRWRGTLGVRFVADGEHYYRINPGPASDQVTITQGEEFRGILVTPLRAWFNLDEEFRVSTTSLAKHITAREG